MHINLMQRMFLTCSRAILGAYFLKEELGILGKLGCAMCLVGSVIIVLHAPADRDVQTVDEILEFALHPAFMFYCTLVLIFSLAMIYKVSPKYGKSNPLVYISICSSVGSVSVMAIKAFGIALKLTMGGNNQFTHPSTYVFIIVVVVCILTQMNYFNKALAQFPTSIVNPVYYVTFTTATLCASFILFRGFNTTDPVNTISLLCGFLIIFSGVYLLNLSRADPNGNQLLGRPSMDGFPTDGLAGLSTRRSMQIRRSIGDGSIRNYGHSRSGSLTVPGRTSTSLMRSFDEERAVGLEDLAEESSSDTEEDKGEDVALRKESRRQLKISTNAPRRSLHSGQITPRTPRTPTGGFKRLV